MHRVRIMGGPVRIRLGHIGTPYIPYLNTTWEPTNPHITGKQLKYVILALCIIYLTYPLYIVSRGYLGKAKPTQNGEGKRVLKMWRYCNSLIYIWGKRWSTCVLCAFGFAHLSYTYGLFGNNCTILVL